MAGDCVPERCAHGGACEANASSNSVCRGCSAGWVGDSCGSAVSEAAAAAFAGAVALVGAVLVFSVLVVAARHNWRPFVARGTLGTATSFVGAAVWCWAAGTNVAGEHLLYDKRDATLWQFWIALVPGFGTWISCNLIYLRTMVSVHVFSRIPFAFPLQLLPALLPWVVVANFQSFDGLLGLCAVLLLYASALGWQLSKVWRDLLDVLPNVAGCVVGLGLTIASTVVVQQRTVDGALDDAHAAYAYPLAVILLVVLHFVATAAPLLALAIRTQCRTCCCLRYCWRCCCCCAAPAPDLYGEDLDFEMTKRYFDEYRPVQLRSFYDSKAGHAHGSGKDKVPDELISPRTPPRGPSIPCGSAWGSDDIVGAANGGGMGVADGGSVARQRWNAAAEQAARAHFDELVAQRRQGLPDQSLLTAVAGQVKPVAMAVDAARRSGVWLKESAVGQSIGGTFSRTRGGGGGTFVVENKSDGGLGTRLSMIISRYSFDRNAYGQRQKGVAVRGGGKAEPYVLDPRGRQTLPPLGGSSAQHSRRQWQSAQKQRVEQQSLHRHREDSGGRPRGSNNHKVQKGPALLDTEPKWGPRSSEALKDLAKFRLNGRGEREVGRTQYVDAGTRRQAEPQTGYDQFDIIRVGSGGEGQLITAVENCGEIDIIVVNSTTTNKACGGGSHHIGVPSASSGCTDASGTRRPRARHAIPLLPSSSSLPSSSNGGPSSLPSQPPPAHARKRTTS